MSNVSPAKQKYKTTTILSDLILSPLSDSVPWREIEIVTLNQHAVDTATNNILTNLRSTTNVPSAISSELKKQQYQTAREFVDLSNDKIIIGIMSDKIDDNAEDRATQLLMQVKMPSESVHEFGNARNLSPVDCTAINAV